MKKINLIMIGIVFVASVVFISIFGMKVMIYNGVIPVTKIECLNQTDERSIVSEDEYGKLIEVKFTTPGKAEDLSGTILQLSHRVFPDNATKKKVKYVYNRELTRVTMATDESGNELGLFLFSGKCYFKVQIMATDGSGICDTVTIWVK